MKMDDVPTEIEIRGVKGYRKNSTRYYSGADEMAVLDVTYRFSLDELVKAGAARLYHSSIAKARK